MKYYDIFPLTLTINKSSYFNRTIGVHLLLSHTRIRYSINMVCAQVACICRCRCSRRNTSPVAYRSEQYEVDECVKEILVHRWLNISSDKGKPPGSIGDCIPTGLLTIQTFGKQQLKACIAFSPESIANTNKVIVRT